MKTRKNITLLIGIFGFLVLTTGVCFLFVPKTAAVVCGIILVCLSLATGILLPNPFSFVGLLAGICMSLCAPTYIGAIFICFGCITAITNLVVWLKAYSKWKAQLTIEI